MKAQASLEMLLIAAIIFLLSIMVLAGFIYLKSETDISIESASIYEFYSKLSEYRKIALLSCSNYRALIEHNFGADVTIERDGILGKSGKIYFRGVEFLDLVNGSRFKFNISCSNNILIIRVVR